MNDRIAAGVGKVVAGVVLAAGCSSAHAAFRQTIADAIAATRISNNANHTLEDHDPQTALGGALTSEALCNNVEYSAATAFAEAIASAGPKQVGVKALATMRTHDTGSFGLGLGSADSVAISDDTLVFDDPHLPTGASINLAFDLRASGDSMANGVGEATFWLVDVSFSILVNNSSVIRLDKYATSTGGVLVDFAPGVHSAVCTVQNRVPYTQRFVASATATVDGRGSGQSAHSLANYGSTFSWMGVTGATDAMGRPLSGYSLRDEFGNDWTTPVPTPAASMAFSGMLVLWRRWR